MIDVSQSSPGLAESVKQLIRDIPDYPKPGITFKDITPLLADASAFARVTEEMAAPFRGVGVTHVVAIESRGFILGAPVAQHLGVGFVPVRKKGKLPSLTRRESYDLEYGTDVLEIHADALSGTSRVLIVDDVLATGGTADAACRLVESLDAEVTGVSFLISLSFLPGLSRLSTRLVRSIVTY